jgi:hypothetical protein
MSTDLEVLPGGARPDLGRIHALLAVQSLVVVLVSMRQSGLASPRPQKRQCR